MIIVETPRLLLRTAQLDDAPFYLELLNQPAWITNIGDRGVRTLDEARAALRFGPMLMQHEHGFSMYMVERKSDAAPLGMCGLIRRDILPDVDIGYAIAEQHCGHGYAFEAAAAVLAHARDTLGLRRLLGITSPANAASNHLLRKLGLRFEATTVLPGRDSATNLYGIDFPDQPGRGLDHARFPPY